MTRVHANRSEILGSLPSYEGQGEVTSRSAYRAGEGSTFEASCYTDPLGIGNLTGSLAETIRHFGRWQAPVQPRFTTKYDAVQPPLDLDHQRRTRIRCSVNAKPDARYEGGTVPVPARLQALRRAALAGSRVGLTIAPIMPVANWREAYDGLLADAAIALEGIPQPDLTVEPFTHRFTPGSKNVRNGWSPGSDLDVDDAQRTRKTTKLDSLKYVYPPEVMRELRTHLERSAADRLPAPRIRYWT